MRIRHILPTLTLLLLLSSFARAQQFIVPFSSAEGTAVATQQARTDLGSDAYLYFVGTLGNLEFQGQKAEFDPKTGKATAWGYSFYSATSTNSKTYLLVKLPLIGVQIVPISGDSTQAPPLPVAPNSIDTAATWFGSTAMVDRLKAQETVYTNYLQQFPDARPGFVTLGQLANDTIEPPQGLPLDQPIWTIMFGGGGDSSIVCFVASKTGETNCRQLQVGGVAEAEKSLSGTLQVIAQPGTDRFALELQAPEGGSMENFSAAVYSVDGKKVADISENFAEGAIRVGILDAAKFSSGKYLIVVSAGNWQAVAGVVVYGS